MVSKDFAIITSFIFIVIVNNKNNIKETFSTDDLAKVRTEINKIYDMDVEYRYNKW